jgi:hypothetical protein
LNRVAAFVAEENINGRPTAVCHPISQ